MRSCLFSKYEDEGGEIYGGLTIMLARTYG